MFLDAFTLPPITTAGRCAERRQGGAAGMQRFFHVQKRLREQLPTATTAGGAGG
jgi:hypothetical protein